MDQTFYDSRRNGLYRDRVDDFYVDKLVRCESMADAHYHPYCELFYIVKGSCKVFAEHSLFNVGEGELVILPTSTLHRTQYDEGIPVSRITVSFTKAYIQNLENITGRAFLEQNEALCKMAFSGQKKKELDSLLEKILAVHNKGSSDLSEIQKKAYLLQLFVMIAEKRAAGDVEEKVNSSAAQRIQMAAKFIYENYSSDLTLQQAAQEAGMRDTYFSALFKKITGFGFKEYLTNIRIQHATQMLENGTLSVTQIALACGFSDGNYFGDAFLKKTGMSPREFRKRKSRNPL